MKFYIYIYIYIFLFLTTAIKIEDVAILFWTIIINMKKNPRYISRFSSQPKSIIFVPRPTFPKNVVQSVENLLR